MVPNYLQGLRSRPGLRQGDRHVLAEASRRPVGAGPRGAGARRHEADEGRDGLQPQQPDRRRPHRGGDGGRDRGRVERRSVDRRGRDLPRRRGGHRRDVADVLGALRQGRRHQRAVEGVRDAGAPRRLGARAAGADRARSGSGTTTRRSRPACSRQARGLRDAARRCARTSSRAHARSSARTSRTSRRGSREHPYLSSTSGRSRGRSRYVKVDLPMTSSRSSWNAIRLEQSVLLVPGEMFGLQEGHPVRVRLRHRTHDEGPRARR